MIELPWPPSVNHYKLPNGRGGQYLTAKAKHYQAAVYIALKMQRAPKFNGDVSLHIQAFPPDKRRRDLDNLFKVVLDCLQSGGVVDDDHQFYDLRITRMHTVDHGSLWLMMHAREF